jgi:hypothetical protein
MNNIKFKVDDIVCLKLKTKTFQGEVDNTYYFTDIEPFKIISVLPDSNYANRVGEIGDSNMYECIRPDGNYRVKFHQYAICLWKDQKEQLFSMYADRLNKWKELG